MATAALRRAMNAFTHPPDTTDADLLRQFAHSRSETAFAALVRRHGPLVLGVCRRMVPDRHLAEDAFQAAFVVLARRAGGIDPARPLGPWLYGVAHRVALRARTMIGRRRKRETLAAGVPEVPHVPPVVDDTTAILDEEIARLPDTTREAVILCELQGLSRREAAKRLGIAEGTLSSRLAAARKVLAAKLRSRGVALTAALAGAAVLSPQLASAAVAAATGASLSSVVVSLADGASAMTLLNKLKLTGVAVLFLLLSAGEVGPWGANQSSAAPVPKEKDHGLVWFHDQRTNTLIGLSPDGKEVERWKLPRGHTFLGVTPDGTRILYEANGTYQLRPFGENTAGTDLGVRYNRFDRIDAWHPDGSQFLKSRHEQPGRMVGVRFPDVDYEIVNVTDGTSIPFRAPENTYTLGWTPDGKQFVGNTVAMGKDSPRGLCLFPLPQKLTPGRPKRIPLTLDDHATPLTFAPTTDGKTQLVGGWKLGSDEKPYHAVYRFDPATGSLAELVHEDRQNQTQVAPSPDRTRMAVVWGYDPKVSGKWGELRLTVAKADGTDRTTVTLRDKSKGDDPQTLALLGWFSSSKIKAPVPKEKADNGLIWTRSVKEHTLTARTPDGTVVKEVVLPEKALFLGFTPDAAKMTFAGKKGKAMHEPGDDLTLHVGDISETCEGTDTGLGWQVNDQFVFSPDGKQVVRSRLEKVGQVPPGGKVTLPEYSHTLYDLGTKKETPIDLPVGHQILQWSADGETWRVMHYNLGDNPTLPSYRQLTASVGEKPKLTPICDGGSFLWLGLQPGGKTLLGAGSPFPTGNDAEPFTLFRVVDGKADPLVKLDGVSFAVACWSPDGKRIGCMKYELDAKNQKLSDTVLVTFEADGTKETKLFTAMNDGHNVQLLGWFPTDPKAAPAKKDDPKAKPPVKESRLLFSFSGKHNGKQFYDSVVSVDPATGQWTVLAENGYRGRVSPDGGTVVLVKDSNVYNVATDGSNNPGKLFEDDGYGGPVFSRDGKHLYVSRLTEKTGRWLHTTSRYTAAGGDPKVIPLPEGEAVLDVSPDGKTFLTRSRGLPVLNTSTLYAMEADGVNKVQLSPDGGFNEPARFSPDGKRVAFVRNSKGENQVWVVETDGKNVAKVFGEKGTFVEAVCWSPDGERLAVIAADLGEGGVIPYGRANGNWRVELISTDGKEKTTLPLKADEVRSLRGPDWYAPPTKPAKPPVKEPIKAPVPKATDTGLVWTYNSSTRELIGYTPDGKKAKEITIEEGQSLLALTPDGKRMLYAAKKGDADGRTLHLRGIDDKDEGVDLGIPFDRARDTHPFHFTADGKKVVRTRAKAGVGNGEWEHVITDLTTKKEQVLKGPDNAHVVGVSPDGSWALILEQPVPGIAFGPGAPRAKVGPPKLHKVPLDGDKPTVLAEGSTFRYATVSPDGKTVLADGISDAVENEARPGMREAVLRIDVATGKITEVAAHALQIDTEVGWSPDGSRIAYLWLDLVGIPKQPNSFRPNMSRLVVCDPDGKNDTTWDVHNYATAESKGYTKLLGWFPRPPVAKKEKDEPKAKPPVKEPIKAPVPAIKAKPPVKLARVPPAPDELRKELAGWDEKYRHGSEEKFAELEKRADELAKGYEGHDQSRIWYTVAHIAGQSNIGKHTDRVRKYAEKCLKLSYDPLDRSRLYSYLASCEEVSKGEFADRRRNAAGWLLKGYLELLVQELPDAKPELPGVLKFRIDGEGPEAEQARAKHAAQVAAREQAVWVCDQIDRRDTLVLHFRNLYEPHPKAHGHGPDGPAELRKLAEAVLPTREDVDTLMKRVLPKGE